jgi:predicted permease
MRILWARFLGWLRRDGVVDEIREEITFHVEARTAEYVRAGLAPSDAARQARARFGAIDRHVHDGYAVRGSGVMETIWQDLTYGVRSLRRQPGFAAVAIATLAMGIGASTAVFSVVDAATLRPLPYEHPEQLVNVGVEATRPGSARRSGLGASVEDVRALRAATGVLRAAAVYRQEYPDLVAHAPAPERLAAISITEGYLEVFGVRPVIGRGFTADEARPNGPLVAMLSHRYWLTRFDGAADVIGRTLSLDRGPATIVGVLPASFRPETQLWLPFQEVSRRGSGADVVARLEPGVSIDQAIQRLTPLLPEDPFSIQPVVTMSSMLEGASAEHTTTSRVLAACVALVLLIGCVNVAGLLLARGTRRERELAVRASLGAGRWRLVRQMLTESLVLASAGGALGVLLVWISIDTIAWYVPITFEPGSSPGVHGLTLAFALGLSIVTSFALGLWPALRLSRSSMQPSLQRASSPPARGVRWLMAVEIAVALVLLTGAGLMLRTVDRLLRVDLGVDPARLVTMDVVPVPLTMASLSEFYPALLETVRRMPAVEAAGATTDLPLGGGFMMVTFIQPVGAPRPTGPVSADHSVRAVTPGFFEAVGLPLRSGRFFTPDDAASGRPILIVAESAARDWFPGGDAVGRQVFVGRTIHEIVGVVADVRHWGPASRSMLAVYQPFVPSAEHIDHGNGLSLAIRQRDGFRVTAADLRAAAMSLGTPVLIDRIATGSELVSSRIVTPRRRTFLLSLLGGLGLVLTLVGIFGLTAYAVARRTREIGVRMAFGARPGQVVGAMLRDTAWPVAIGIVAGLVGASFATKLIASFLFQTTPTDVPTFVAVAVVLATAALVAAWIPARRAARVDPVAALRAE